MKKLVAIGLSMLMVFGMSGMSFANGKGPAPKQHKIVEITNENVIEAVQGEEIIITSTIPKQSSTFVSDTWESAIYDAETDSFVATKAYTFTKLGEQTIYHTIIMTSGKSGLEFHITNTLSVNVVAPTPQRELLSYQITEWTKGDAIYNSNQTNIIGYQANGKLWEVYSDGLKVLVNNNFNFSLTRQNDNLQTPEIYKELPVSLEN